MAVGDFQFVNHRAPEKALQAAAPMILETEASTRIDPWILDVFISLSLELGRCRADGIGLPGEVRAL